MTTLTRPPPAICAWCPGFDHTDPANRGRSHGICPTCAAKLAADLLAREQQRAAASEAA
jgi:hypothetical protein